MFVTVDARRHRSARGLLATLGVHGAAVAALLFSVPPLRPAAVIEPRDYGPTVVFDVAPPPPPPLPVGNPHQPRTPARRSLPKPSPAPDVRPLEPDRAQPSPTVELPPPDATSFGSEQGSLHGTVDGTEEGRPGGQPGGVAHGLPGGAPGGTGTQVARDYDRPPRPIKLTRPRYPSAAFTKKIEGTVVVEILIDERGRVTSARVVQSVPLLDEAARETVGEWIFSPAMKDGRPVPALAHAPVTFRIF